MASWQAQTAHDFLCHAPSSLGSIQFTLPWLGAWAGQCIRTELGGWNISCQMRAGQGNTQLTLEINSVLSWEMLGREG